VRYGVGHRGAALRVDLTPADEHVALQDAVRRFIERELRPLEAKLDPAVDIVPVELRNHVRTRSAELGFYAADFPEEVGGQGLSQVGMVLLREAAEAIPCRTINARTAFITDHAAALRRMVQAIDEANAIINAEPVAEEIVAIAHAFTGAPPEAIVHGNHRLKFTTRLDQEGLCELGDELVRMGHIRECPAGFMYAREFRGITWE